MLRLAGSASNPNSRSGADRWKKREGVRLHDLAEVDHPPQVLTRGGRLDGEDVVDGLGRCDQVADGADAADAGHDGRHLVDGASLRDALEATELGHVEVRVDHLATIVELDGDFGVAFDPGDGIDDDFAGHVGSRQRPNRAPVTSGTRPASRSSSML